MVVGVKSYSEKGRVKGKVCSKMKMVSKQSLFLIGKLSLHHL